MESAGLANLFVVGAAKCATTAMCEYLGRHPDIFMSAVKEPYYFGVDLDILSSRRVCDAAEYERLFQPARDARYRGEGSVWYMYSRTACREIHSYNPNARIIIMLRNPVDMMYSLHGQFLKSLNEDVVDFAEALAAESDRKQGHRIPVSSHFPMALQYRSVATFSHQVQRFFDVFDRDRVHIILFDDVVTDTAGTYKAVLGFLDVDESFVPSFNIVNPSGPIRHTPFARLLKTHPGVHRFVQLISPLGPRRWIGEMIRARRRPIERPRHIDPQLRSQLQAEFSEEIERLSVLLNRDLTGWLMSGAVVDVGTQA